MSNFSKSKKSKVSSCSCLKNTDLLSIQWQDLCDNCKEKYLLQLKNLVDNTVGYTDALRKVYLAEDISNIDFQLRLDMRRDGIIENENTLTITEKGRDFVLRFGV